MQNRYVPAPEGYIPMPRRLRAAIEVDVEANWAQEALKEATHGRVLDSDQIIQVILDTVDHLIDRDRIKLGE